MNSIKIKFSISRINIYDIIMLLKNNVIFFVSDWKKNINQSKKQAFL